MTMPSPEPTRWTLGEFPSSILWNVADAGNPANHLPHADHVEMSGRRISVIIRYRINAQRRLFVERDIFWPQLFMRENDVRGYLHRVYDDRLIIPRFLINDNEWFPANTPVDQVTFDGVLTFHYAITRDDIAVTRTIFPSPTKAGMFEQWSFHNQGVSPALIIALSRNLGETDSGVYGRYTTQVRLFKNPFASREIQSVDSHEKIVFSQLFHSHNWNAWVETENGSMHISDPEEAWKFDQMPRIEDANDEENERRTFTHRIQSDPAHATFTCPDPVLNQAFAFAKLRAAESLFETKLMGLVHSPGGGNYYGGIWANDQCEYANPFFAFLNDPSAMEASVNAYRHYAKHMKPDYTPVPTSFEMGGTIPYQAGGDRGDAAMIASGMSRYLLTIGDRTLATELYPALQWCLEYCCRKTDTRGIVLSDTDELEGRFSTGDANLSTSCLAYDGLRRGADLARALGHTQEAEEWSTRADALALAIEAHFGAIIEGFPTYCYHEGNTILRSWICLPLVFGLAEGERKEGTLAALFSPRLWKPDGLATEAGDKTFWDRSTLYGLRGAFAAGATEIATTYLQAYSRRRLLGDHVPYPVEAYPENAQAHLSAESALYCRIFIEGLLGLVPTGFDSFSITPRLPADWPDYTLRFTAFGGRDITITIARAEENLLRVTAHTTTSTIYNQVASEGITHYVKDIV